MLASWKGKIMAGIGENDLSLSSSKDCNYAAYAGLQIKNNIRIYSSYGRDQQLELIGVHKNIIESGVKIAFH